MSALVKGKNKLQLWNLYAKLYESLRSNPFSKIILNVENRALCNMLALRIPNRMNGQALDLGTGRGNCLQFIPSDISQIYALDKSSKMVTLTSNIYKHAEVCIGEVCQTHHADKSMDLILCVGVSEYVPNSDALLAEIKRVLHYSGYVVFTASPPNPLNQIRRLLGHKLFLRAQSDTVESILKNNFTIVSSTRTLIQDQYLLIHNSRS